MSAVIQQANNLLTGHREVPAIAMVSKTVQWDFGPDKPWVV